MFIKDANDKDVEALVKLLSNSRTRYKDKSFRAFIYLLGADESKAKALSKKTGATNIAFALLTDKERADTLKMYKINPKAKTTLFVYDDRIISAKLVNFKAGSKDEAALNQAIEEVCR